MINSGSPFARFRAIAAMIAAAMSMPVAQRREALQAVPAYASRGKGKGLWGGKKYTARMRRNSTLHPTNGAREVARRRRQLAAGTLRTN